MAKTHTSWQVKQRYNEKVYARIGVMLEKDLVEKFKTKCVDYGVSQASIIREAIEKFVKED